MSTAATSTGRSTISGFVGTSRYELLRRLGSGGMGVVYAVRDRQTGRQLALKTLHWREGEEIYKLKREFRSLADLSHPNLVTLHELHAGEDGVFFTMELVEGQSFVEHVRAGIERRQRAGIDGKELLPVEYDALRGLVRQLVEGVDALHAAGRLHRDIKPANVLVSKEGRVVLLDFGVATAIRPTASDPEDTSKKRVVGTVAYMAPEQGWGLEVGPAADWYAAGVMLYEALVGEKPFSGALVDVLAAKEAMRIPSPKERVPSIPADLDRLVMQLLDPLPDARPDALGILSALGVSLSGLRSRLSASRVHSGRARDPLVGRERELVALREALAAVAPGKPVVLRIHGEPGLGRTALVESFLQEVRPDLAACFGSRCHAQEDIPFKALDGLVDALSRYLLDLEPDRRRALAEETTPELVRLFPVLGGVPDLRWADWRRGDPTAESSAENPSDIQRRGLAGLAGLLGWIAGDRPLALWVDDLQWGDLDSARALQEILRPPSAPPVLLLLSFSSREREAPAVQALQAGRPGMPEVREIELQPLGPGAIATLVRRLLGPAAMDALPALVQESGGSPFVLAELARHRRQHPEGEIPPLDGVIRARLEALPAGPRRLLELVTLAGRPLEPELAGVAALLDDPEAAIASLVSEHLLRRTARGRLDLYQERVRQVVLEGLSPGARQEHHRRLARAMQSLERTGPGELGVHVAAAGDARTAAELVARAAAEARQVLAFHLAAALYGRAAGLLPEDDDDRWVLLDRQAEALSRAGRSGDAARAWLSAVALLDRKEPAHPQIKEMQRRGAEQLLRGGRLQDGLVVLSELLGQEGLAMPASYQEALRRLFLDRMRLRLRGLGWRPAGSLDPALLRRLDTCWAAAMGLCWVDSMRSAVFQCRFALLALALGEPDRVARALATEAAFSANEGGAANRRRSAVALSSAREVAAGLEGTGGPETRAIVEICAAAAAFFSARFEDAACAAEISEEVLSRQGGGHTWELLNAYIFGLWSRAYLGDLDALRHRLPDLIQEARDRGDLLSVASLSSGVLGLGLLAEDRPDAARRQADDAMALWTHDGGFHTQHYMNLVARAQIEVYQGDPIGAWLRLDEALPRMKRAMMLRLQYVRMESTWLRARVALAALSLGAEALVAAGFEPLVLRRQVRRDAAALSKEDLPWGRVLSTGLRAGLAILDGDEAARGLLEEAVARFNDAGMALHREAARWQLGRLLPDQPEIRARADAWMRERGVVRPDRLVQVLVPGRPPT